MENELFVQYVDQINNEINDFLTNQYNPMLEDLNDKLRNMVEKYDIRKQPLITMTEDEIINTILNQVPANKNGDFKKPFDPQEYIDITDEKIKNLIEFMDNAINKSEEYPASAQSYYMLLNMNQWAADFYLSLKTEKFLSYCKQYDVEIDLNPSTNMYELMVEFNHLFIKYLTYSVDTTSTHLFHKSTITKKNKVIEDNKDRKRIHTIECSDCLNNKPYLEILRGEINGFLSFKKPKEIEEMYEMPFYDIHSVEGPYYANFKDLYKQRKGLINAYNQLQMSLRHSHLLLNVSIPRVVGNGVKTNVIPLLILNETGIYVFQTIESKKLEITEDERKKGGDIIIKTYNSEEISKPSESLTPQSILYFARDNARNLAYFLEDKLGYTGDVNNKTALLRHNLQHIHYGVIFMKGDIVINTINHLYNIGEERLYQYIESDKEKLSSNEVASFYQLFKPLSKQPMQYTVFKNIETCVSDFESYSKNVYDLINSYGNIHKQAQGYFESIVEKLTYFYDLQLSNKQQQIDNYNAILTNNKKVIDQKQKEDTLIKDSFIVKYLLVPYPIILCICSFVCCIMSLFHVEQAALCAICIAINALVAGLFVVFIRSGFNNTFIKFDKLLDLFICGTCILAPILSIIIFIISEDELFIFVLALSIIGAAITIKEITRIINEASVEG